MAFTSIFILTPWLLAQKFTPSPHASSDLEPGCGLDGELLVLGCALGTMCPPELGFLPTSTDLWECGEGQPPAGAPYQQGAVKLPM